MSTQKIGNELIWECDECGATSAGHDPDDYQAEWAMLKEDGWRAFLRDNRWNNCCPDCRRNYGREQAEANNNDVRAEIARKRDNWRTRPQRTAAAPERGNPPPRRRSNERPPWE